MKTLVLAILTLSFCHAWAIGDEKENGGDVIVCGTGDSSSYELLDLYEAKALHRLDLVPPQGTALADIFEQRMKALEGIDATRAALYRGYMASFMAEARFVPNSDFTDIPDEGFKAPPAGCTLRQIVVQYDIPTPDGVRYMVNQDLWSHLDEENRAGLLIHEFMYREGRFAQNNFRTSSGVRYFNALVHSTKIARLSLQEYIVEMRAIGYQEVVVQAEPVVLFVWNADKPQKIVQDIEFHTNGKVAKATLANHFFLPGVSKDEITCHKAITDEHSIYFFESGNIATIHIGCGDVAYSFKSGDVSGFSFGSTFTYDDAGHIYNIFTENSQAAIFRYWSSKVHISGMLFEKPSFASVTFYENGLPSMVETSTTKHWFYEKNQQSQWQSFVPQYGRVMLTPDGDIQTAAH
ncbi:MAG: hypothetical protein JSU04_11510 [Bdellovibrionales bacterium]|nr:hypothetical protein [Bdellovibrionales bacterium]